MGEKYDKITYFGGRPTQHSHVITLTFEPKYSPGLLPCHAFSDCFGIISKAMVNQEATEPSSMKRANMAAFLPKVDSRYHLRSISLPARSHPSTVKVEEELSKLKACKASSSTQTEKICGGLSGLVELYRCVEDLLNMPLTQQALAQNQHEKWVNELLDGSVRYLDICSKTRDYMLLMKERVSELQSALRRRKGAEFSIESNLAGYICCRKKMKKEAAKSLSSLKQMENKLGAAPCRDLDQHLSAVVRVLREAILVTAFIFEQLLMFLCATVLKPKPTKWSLVSKLMHKGVVACEDQGKKTNELEGVDIAVNTLMVRNPIKSTEADNIQSALKSLESLDSSIERLDNGLGCLFRPLIQTRVSLLNIFSR